MQGAGGTQGGIGLFFVSIVMMVSGFYLLLQSIHVGASFGLGARLFGWSGVGGVGITGGMLLIPFVFGVGLIFYNRKNLFGWVLAGGAVVMLIAGVLASLTFTMRSMTAFDILTILVLSMGGVGLFLRSLHNFEPKHS